MSVPVESRSAVERALAARTTPAVRDGLRAAVIAFARDAHAAGTSSEQVLIQLKRMQMDAHDTSLASVDTRLLRDDIVRWAIDAYYRS